jgi:hypothetical protein
MEFMDNSSRNIVKFIAAITFAALLMMAARYYADSQKVQAPAEVAEKASAKEEVSESDTNVESEGAEANPDDPKSEDEQIVEEDAELIMGEPSVNLEQGGSTDYTPTQPVTEEPAIEE